MRPRSRKQARSLSSWGALAAALGVALACSSAGKTFFEAPAISHAGAGGSGGTLGSNTGGTGDQGAADAGTGAAAGSDAGGAPDGTGGTGGSGDATGMAGDMSTGGSGGTSAAGGKGASGGVGGASAGQGGSTPTGGTGGDAAGTGGTTGGDMSGVGGDAMAGTAGLPAGGAGSGNLGGAGGLGGAGLGGAGAGSGGVGAGMGGMSGSASCVPTEPSDEICDGIDNDCDGDKDGPGVCPDNCVGAVHGKHRYLLCSGVGDYTFTRQEAHTWCVDDFSDALDVSLDLTRVDDEEENDFLLGLIAANKEEDPIWMAASDASQISDGGEGYWVWGPHSKAVLFWANDAPVDDAFSDWGKGQPDDGGAGVAEDCAVFDPELDWHWNDRGCSDETSTLICEQLDN